MVQGKAQGFNLINASLFLSSSCFLSCSVCVSVVESPPVGLSLPRAPLCLSLGLYLSVCLPASPSLSLSLLHPLSQAICTIA